MKNTVLQNVISNFNLMDKQHFLDWFKENKEVILEKEKQQIIDAGNWGGLYSDSNKTAETYYKETFKQ